MQSRLVPSTASFIVSNPMTLQLRSDSKTNPLCRVIMIPWSSPRSSSMCCIQLLLRSVFIVIIAAGIGCRGNLKDNGCKSNEKRKYFSAAATKSQCSTRLAWNTSWRPLAQLQMFHGNVPRSKARHTLQPSARFKRHIQTTAWTPALHAWTLFAWTPGQYISATLRYDGGRGLRLYNL